MNYPYMYTVAVHFVGGGGGQDSVVTVVGKTV